MQKNLRDGLIMRTLSEGVQSDRESLQDFYVSVFGDGEDEAAHAYIRAWVSDLMVDEHPTTTLDDLWVVVDPTHDDRIVSALLLIPQTWRYEDVEVGVGRVELVATNPDYRRRGLVRAMMDALHERSTAMGHLMQSITGIPNYYRRFGYTMAVNLGTRCAMPMRSIAKLKDDEQPKFTLRDATVEDAPQLVAWDAYHSGKCLFSTLRDEKTWRYEIASHSQKSMWNVDVKIIVDAQNQNVGYVILRCDPVYKNCDCFQYVVGSESSYLATFMDVMRGIKSYAEKRFAEFKVDVPAHINLSTTDATLDKLIQKSWPGALNEFPYAWYLRVGDLPAFIRHIAPVLERRLENSGAHRYSGELKIMFYDFTGLKLTFEDGKLKDAVSEEMDRQGTHAAFPDLTFLNVLFGYHSAAELREVFPEVYTSREGLVLLDILFPKKRSALMPLS